MTDKEALDNVINFYNQVNQSLTGHQTRILEMSLRVLQQKINPPEEPKKDSDG